MRSRSFESAQAAWDYMLPSDEPETEPCITRCPKCRGAANGVRIVKGKERDEDGAWESIYEVTGIDCEACGYREGDECYESEAYENL